ncbi:MAG: hypothetical protein VYE68_11475 [Acidobacteriota bacterium]|nr:hypothetical protein [Acidobacteriota bacterium]
MRVCRSRSSRSADATYGFARVVAEHEGFSGTTAGFESDFTGNNGRIGYGFSATELDITISGTINDSDLSGLLNGDGNSTTGQTLIFTIGKTFALN